MRTPALQLGPSPPGPLEAATLEALAEAGVADVGPLSWQMGRPLGGPEARARVALVIQAPPTPEALATWIDLLGERGYSAGLRGTSAQLERLAPGGLAPLPGLGLWPISAGADGQPLMGRPLGPLREQLAEGRARLERAGAPLVRVIAPSPGPLGISVDRLIWREARRAGYTWLLVPALQPVAPSDRVGPSSPLRQLEGPDDPDEIVAWVQGGPLARARGKARLMRRRLGRWLLG